MAGYQTKRERIVIRGAASLLIRSLFDRLQYDDPRGEAEAAGFSAATWPLFGLLWPSGLQLAAQMAARPLRANERILEVGCGLGLASLVCHRQGADITASDSHPLAGHFLRRNARLNGLRPMDYRHGRWTDPTALSAAHSSRDLQGRFDLIIGSDVLYERDEPGHLARFIARHASPEAEILIVDPNRGNRAAFTRRMQAQGYVLRETALSTPEADGLPYRGRLLHYARC
ncbi:methyltransferase domain-containing protein [Ideonella sp. DXS22W]|uniref:Methyltransferase domain-containing protein n=1 Tax=Pseudaquabacterium inlustre TaxID=2984192 RepID=A0ABU9CKE1_9BURK